MFGHPAPIIARFYPTMVNPLPSSINQSGLDLANRNILWASVTSAGIPLPIDSCCSISLVSKKDADLVSQNCSDLKFTKLATPLSISVASAESKLQAVGMMQILIVNNFCLYPPPVLRCFWKDPLMTPILHHPTSSIFHCYPPPHPPPLPPKNFDHTLGCKYRHT